MDTIDTGPHPAARKLAAFARGDLAGAESERTTLHLAACPACRRIVSDLRGDGSAGDRELDAAWAALRARIDLPRAGARREAADPRGSRRRRVLAAAAALGAVLLGASAWFAASTQGRLEEARRRIARLEASLAEARAPQAGVAAVDLVPRGVLRDAGGVPRLELAPGTRLALLRLLLTGSGEGERHRLTARDEAGRRLWTVEDVRTDATQHADVVLPVEDLPPGTVDLVLVRVDGGDEETVAVYAFRVLRGES